MIDYSAVNPQVLEDKAKFGTKIHEYCLWLSKGDLDMDDLKPYPKYWNRVEGWRQFIEDFKFKFDLDWCEVPCAVKVNGILYAMTIDCYGSYGEGENISLAVVEIKTCADQEPSHAIQTAGQAIAFHHHAETVQTPAQAFRRLPARQARCRRPVLQSARAPPIGSTRRYFCRPSSSPNGASITSYSERTP